MSETMKAGPTLMWNLRAALRFAFPAFSAIPFLVPMLVLGLILDASPAPAQIPAGPPEAECAEGVVSSLEIDNRPVFDPDELREGHWLRGVYSFANALHVTTRPSFVRRELFFREGDCWDPDLVEDSGRNLRTYVFLGDAVIESTPLADGSHRVTVTTRDEWSTQLDVGVAIDQGFQLERVTLAEENLLGRGILAELFMRRRKERRDLGVTLREPRFLGTRAIAGLGWGRSRVGNFLNQSLSHPFVGEAGRWAFRQSVSEADEVFVYSTGLESGITHLLLPVERSGFELTVAGRFGNPGGPNRPGSLTLAGLGVARDRMGPSPYEGGVEAVTDSDFAAAVTAPRGLVREVTGPFSPYGVTRINLLLSQRNLSFARVGGLDAVRGEQDVRLGAEAEVTLGVGIGDWGADGVGRGDLFGSTGIFAGHRFGDSFLFIGASAEARRRPGGELVELPGTWRDVLAEADLLAYLRSGSLPNQTLVARVAASGGWRNDLPFQLTRGGRESGRGLREEAYPGAHRLILTLEDRIALNWPAPDHFDSGITLFADAGRMWGGDVPYGADSGWLGSLGVGLRIGFPDGAPRATRIDLALPVGAAGAGPILRVSMREFVGISRSSGDSQLGRSRLAGVRPGQFVRGSR